MSTFPAGLIPSTRTYSLGQYPSTTHQTYSGEEVRVRHSNAVTDVRLRLFFPALSTSEMLQIRSHYVGQKGRYLSFDLSDDLLSGVTAPAGFTPSGQRWLYAGRPQVVDISVDGDLPSNLHDVTVELISIPERAAVFVPRCTFRMTVLAPSVVGSIPPIVDVPSVAFTMSVLAPTVGATAPVGPVYSDFDFLLPCNGPNGSTTLTDVSTNAVPVFAQGGAQISTAIFKWGGSSLYLDGSGDYALSNAASATTISGDWTTGFWFYPLDVTGVHTLLHINAGGNNGIHIYTNGTALLVDNGLVADYSSPSGVVGINTWAYYELCQSGSTIYIFKDGALLNSRTAQSYGTPDRISIGRFSTGFITPDAHGYYNDVFLINGTAFRTAAFTPPAAAYPTS